MTKGVKALMKEKRYQTKHITQELKKNNIPGNWDSYQNIYNLVDGTIKPKDPYVYIVISRMLDITIEDVILRYSEVEKSPSTEDSNKEIGDIKLTNKYSNW